MRILTLKNRKVQKEWALKVRCTGRGPMVNHNPCRSKLCLDANDIFYVDVPGAYMTNDRHFGFICPECGCFTKIWAIRIPKIIRINARCTMQVQR